MTRNRSEKTTISSQIQITHMKKMNMVQITCQNVSASNKVHPPSDFESV